MKANKLKEKYTPKELADAFVFRTKLSPKERKESDAYLNEMRIKKRKDITPAQLLLARLLQLKYQMEDYLTNDSYDLTHSFASYLREYLNSLNKKNKEFAKDIDIDETELSQILNNHRKPSEKLIIRLEIHSNKTIPAITWFKLLEKEKEHEFLTNTIIRKTEGKHVKNRLKLSI
jgi:transcriptional regulator with XRE-family HTH domain